MPWITPRIVLQRDAASQIYAQEVQHDCDLIVMGKHGTHVTEELIRGSVVKHVLAESRGDVLVVVHKRPSEIIPVTP